MTQTFILLFTLGMLAGLPSGYALAWVYDFWVSPFRSVFAIKRKADRLMVAYAAMGINPQAPSPAAAWMVV